MRFQNQVIWITGASSGIGEALAYALAAEGAKLVLSARRHEMLEKVRLACTEPDRHLVLPLDMTDIGTFGPSMQYVLDRLGRIDMLINNAGVSQRSLVRETSLAVDRALMETDFFGPVALVKTVLPYMLSRRQGRIVAVSSIAGLIATPMRSTYAAAKSALKSFHDALRAEVHDSGVGVTVIYPGFIRTPLPLAALTGTGAPQGFMDAALEQGLPAEEFARQALNALAAGQAHVVIGGGKERLAMYLDRLSPAITRQLMRRVKVV